MDTLRFGRVEIRSSERQLLIDARPVSLGARAFDVLQALVERRDRLVTKAELLDIVWPGLVVEENNLQVQVSALRKLLGPAAIATIPGRGYRFTLGSKAEGSAQTPPADAQASAPSRFGTLSTTPPGNLPLQAAPIVGRAEALIALNAWIDQRGLPITLVGAPGIGKTTLALAAALPQRDLRRFRDGVWWVDLASITDPELLLQAITRALRIAQSHDDSLDRLLGALSSQQMLLVLDNAEHLVDAVSRLVAALAAEAPGVCIVTTSQEVLKVPGEHVFRLDPLSVPAPGEAVHEQRHGAVALFAERARAADPRFVLGPDNENAVADICRRLDGMPLAIELAAARVPLLGVRGVRDRLDARFGVLTGGSRTALPRHKTLHAALDWSHGLLKPTEQTLLRRLGVFIGGFSLSLVQAVCTDETLDEWRVLESLGALVDKSLVVVDSGDPVRYRLLESTRAYALERLTERDELADVRRRHARALRELFVGTDAERHDEGGTLDTDTLIARLAPEMDNWRAALEWEAGPQGDVAAAIAMTTSGSFVLRSIGLAREGLDRLLRLRDHIDDVAEPALAARFHVRLGTLGTDAQWNYRVLLEGTGRAESALRALNDRRWVLDALYTRGFLLAATGDNAGARAIVDDMAALEREDDPGWLRVLRLNLRGVIAMSEFRFEDAAATHREQHECLLRVKGETFSLATSISNLCVALNGQRRYAEVIDLVQPVLQAGNPVTRPDYMFQHLLHAQVRLGRLEDARRTLHQALPLWRRGGALRLMGWLISAFLARVGQLANSVRVQEAGMQAFDRMGMKFNPIQQLAGEEVAAALAAAGVAAADIERWQREGRALGEADVGEVCEAISDGPQGAR